MRRYISHFIDVETPIVAFAALFFVAPAFVDRARVPLPRLLSGGMAAGVALSYLFYQPYEEWTYLRFFLPMWPILMVLAAAGVFAVARRWAERASLLAAAVCIVFAALLGLDTASARGVFALWRGERKYADVARFIEEQTDPRAVLVSMQHSGSLRLYTGRLTLRYDVLEPNRLDHAVEYLESIDRRPYIVLDTWELDAFRRRFAASSRLGALDWTPIAALPGATWVFSTDPGRLSDTASIASSADDRWLCHTPVSER
ncbi:MAG: hypothetical protein HY655_13480 [Acidobacteria bacterium]|nr:hypothetical protein [Acidobacteriota bacterium]